MGREWLSLIWPAPSGTEPDENKVIVIDSVVCVDEALLAYRLEKEGLTAPQIRDRIVAEYSRQ